MVNTILQEAKMRGEIQAWEFMWLLGQIDVMLSNVRMLVWN